jgi:hypothetical protein
MGEYERNEMDEIMENGEWNQNTSHFLIEKCKKISSSELGEKTSFEISVHFSLLITITQSHMSCDALWKWQNDKR